MIMSCQFVSFCQGKVELKLQDEKKNKQTTKEFAWSDGPRIRTRTKLLLMRFLTQLSSASIQPMRGIESMATIRSIQFGRISDERPIPIGFPTNVVHARPRQILSFRARGDTRAHRKSQMLQRRP